MLSSQSAYVDPGGRRMGERSVKAVSLPNLIYQVKSSYFLIIFEDLNSAKSGLRISPPKYVG